MRATLRATDWNRRLTAENVSVRISRGATRLFRVRGYFAAGFVALALSPSQSQGQILDAGVYTDWYPVWSGAGCGVDLKQQPGVFLGDRVVWYILRNRCAYNVEGTLRSEGAMGQDDTFYLPAYDRPNKHGGDIGSGETWLYGTRIQSVAVTRTGEAELRERQQREQADHRRDQEVRETRERRERIQRDSESLRIAQEARQRQVEEYERRARERDSIYQATAERMAGAAGQLQQRSRAGVRLADSVGTALGARVGAGLSPEERARLRQGTASTSEFDLSAISPTPNTCDSRRSAVISQLGALAAVLPIDTGEIVAVTRRVHEAHAMLRSRSGVAQSARPGAVSELAAPAHALVGALLESLAFVRALEPPPRSTDTNDVIRDSSGWAGFAEKATIYRRQVLLSAASADHERAIKAVDALVKAAGAALDGGLDGTDVLRAAANAVSDMERLGSALTAMSRRAGMASLLSAARNSCSPAGR